MQALTPIFLLTMALITNTFAMPAASPDTVEYGQPSGTANLMVTVFSFSNECYGGAHTGIDMDYNTDYPVADIVSYYVSRNLTANEQMDFSTNGPAATLSSGYSIAPSCSKFSKTVSPGYEGEPLTSGSPTQPQCYSANGESVSLRILETYSQVVTDSGL